MRVPALAIALTLAPGLLGGLGHCSVTARGNAADVVPPDPNYDGGVGLRPSF